MENPILDQTKISRAEQAGLNCLAVKKLLNQGYRNGQIAKEIGITPAGVTRIVNILKRKNYE